MNPNNGQPALGKRKLADHSQLTGLRAKSALTSALYSCPNAQPKSLSLGLAEHPHPGAEGKATMKMTYTEAARGVP
jgi:hypothetical protein